MHVRQKYLRLFFLLLFYLFGQSLLAINVNFADSILNGLKLETNIQYGTILPHHEGIKYIIDKNLKSFEICLTTESANRHMWESLYRFPRYGIGYNFKNFGNNNILGNGHAIFAFIDIPLIYLKNEFFVTYRFNVGTAFISENFNHDSNPLNQAISKKNNVFIGLDLLTHYQIDSRNEVMIGLELSHYSNGKVRTPNMGLNIVCLSGTFVYDILKDNPERRKIIKSKSYHHTIDMVSNIGLKRDDFLSEQLYFVNTYIADYNYYYSRKYSVGAGFDFFYDGSIGANKENLDDGKALRSDNYRAGAHIAFTSRFNRMNIIINIGQYFYNNYHRYSEIYTRIGIRYAISDNFLLNFTVKSHYAIADYTEWGIGYRFNFLSK